MKQKLCFMVLVCLFTGASAQTSFKKNGLAIGDYVPDITIPNIINHPTGTAKLSDYKGKLLILDFWATWCSPCVAMLPKSDSLNKAYKNKAIILPITYQSKEEVLKLFNKSARLRDIEMPIGTSDTQLRELFPHTEIPHYVWIDQQGKVQAITDHREVNGPNIAKMIASPVSALTEKRDIAILPYNKEIPLLFKQVEISPEDIYYQSTVLGYKEGFPSRIDVLRYPDNTIARITGTNLGLKHLYAYAYSTDDEVIKVNRVIAETADPKFGPPVHPTVTSAEYNHWLRTNGYCYELSAPNAISKNFLDMMKEDLARIFHHHTATFEKRETKVLAIIRTSAADKIMTKGNPPKLDAGHFGFTITNGKLQTLVSNFNYTLQHLNTPVIDDTGYTGNVDLSLNCNQSDVESIRSALKKYDLDLVYKTKPINMVVIRDAH